MGVAMRTTANIVTLGPSGTNHEMIAKKYVRMRKLRANVLLIDDFFDGLEMMRDDQADFMLQVAVHPDFSNVVAKAHFDYGIHIIDTFISSSKNLCVITQRGINTPKTLALQPATELYADLSKWEEKIYVSSIMNIADALLSGKYDSGLTTIEFAERYSDKFRVEIKIESVDDPWVLFGKNKVTHGEPVLWEECPAMPNLSRFRL